MAGTDGTLTTRWTPLLLLLLLRVLLLLLLLLRVLLLMHLGPKFTVKCVAAAHMLRVGHSCNTSATADSAGACGKREGTTVLSAGTILKCCTAAMCRIIVLPALLLPLLP